MTIQVSAAFSQSCVEIFSERGKIEVVKLVSSIMPLLALFQVFDGTSAVTGGVLRARGKQFVGALLNLRHVRPFISLPVYHIR